MSPSVTPLMLTSDQVAYMMGISVRTLFRHVALGLVPEPIRYNRKLIRWKRQEIIEHVARLKSKS